MRAFAVAYTLSSSGVGSGFHPSTPHARTAARKNATAMYFISCLPLLLSIDRVSLGTVQWIVLWNRQRNRMSFRLGPKYWRETIPGFVVRSQCYHRENVRSYREYRALVLSFVFSLHDYIENVLERFLDGSPGTPEGRAIRITLHQDAKTLATGIHKETSFDSVTVR